MSRALAFQAHFSPRLSGMALAGILFTVALKCSSLRKHLCVCDCNLFPAILRIHLLKKTAVLDFLDDSVVYQGFDFEVADLGVLRRQ
jgi:hypothetical protein